MLRAANDRTGGNLSPVTSLRVTAQRLRIHLDVLSLALIGNASAQTGDVWCR
jgi:hypothetical protein